MASPPRAAWLRQPPVAARPARSGSTFSTVSICGLFSLPGASRVSSVSFRRRPSSPLIRYSQDPGKIEVFNTEGIEQSQGDSTGSINYGKDSARRFSSKEYSQLTIARETKESICSSGDGMTSLELLMKFYFSPAPVKMGYAAAVERFLKLMAMVWAGSQVTKILRAGGALALAPFVDRGLRWFTVRFNFKSEGKAFATIVGFCFALAALLFFGLTILWA